MKNINWIFKNRFVTSVLTLVSGSMFAQCITVVASFLFARIYSPEELGVYTLILTAESLFGSVVCLRYELLVVSEENEGKVYPIIKLSTMITMVLSLAIAFIYGGYQFIIKSEYRIYWYAILFIVCMLFFHGMINILDAYNNRCQQYKLMTEAYVERTLVQNVGAIILGLLGFGVFGIVFSHTVGLLFGMKKQSKRILRNFEQIKGVPLKEIKYVMRENYRQPLYSSPAVFANRYSYSSITLFIEELFGAKTLGYYSISYKALGLPLSVLSNNISKVFFREASREYERKGTYINTLVKISSALIAISIPMGVVIYFLAPWGVDLLLGEEWGLSAHYIQILIPMFCIRFVCNGISQGLQIAHKQHFELIFQMMLVVMSIISFVIARINDLQIDSFLGLIAVSFSIIYILYFVCVLIYSKKRRGNNENQ